MALSNDRGKVHHYWFVPKHLFISARNICNVQLALCQPETQVMKWYFLTNFPCRPNWFDMVRVRKGGRLIDVYSHGSKRPICQNVSGTWLAWVQWMLLHPHFFHLSPFTSLLFKICTHKFSNAKIWGKKTAHFQELANNKKSTIFVLSSWKSVEMVTSWGNDFYQVSWG